MMQYHVAYKKKTDDAYHVIPNNVFTWTADPFLFEYKGDVYIFGEIWKYSFKDNGHGTIGYCKLSQGRISKWNVVIEEPYHLSFPNIFSDGDDIYICPESAEMGEIYLYKAISFPDKWEKADVLYDGGDKMVDTVFFQQDGKQYGFTLCISDVNGIEKNELKLFHIENKKIHFIDCLNPITTDKTCARCAGKVIKEGKKNFRVAQDCGHYYGKGLVFCEFNFEETYSEKVEKTIYPGDLNLDKKMKVVGTHTYNSISDYEVIDIRVEKCLLSMLFLRAIRFLNRKLRNV